MLLLVVKFKSTNVRINTADLLKGIAVILMIQVHITELFIEPSFLETQVGKALLFLGGVPAAPIFMTVMGFFITFLPKSFSSNLKRGLKLIVWGILLNTGINFTLLINIFFNNWAYDPLPYIFGVDILFLAGVSVILIAIISRYLKNNVLVFALLALLSAVLSDVVPVYQGYSNFMRYLAGFIVSKEWWSYFPIFPWLAYPLAGASVGLVFKEYQKNIKQKSYLLIIPFALAAVWWNFGYSTSVDLFAYYHHGIKFFLWALMLIILLVAGAYLLDQMVADGNFIKRYLIWTGRNVTAFYIIQWLIIGNTATWLFKSESPLLFPVWFLAVTAITSILVLLYKRGLIFYQSSKQLKHI